MTAGGHGGFIIGVGFEEALGWVNEMSVGLGRPGSLSQSHKGGASETFQLTSIGIDAWINGYSRKNYRAAFLPIVLHIKYGIRVGVEDNVGGWAIDLEWDGQNDTRVPVAADDGGYSRDDSVSKSSEALRQRRVG